jgi:polysaccharide deacetylase family protein (PEP-CTERM system associated)
MGMINAFTVDVEDWYQGLTSTSRQIEKWPAFEDRVVQNTLRLLDLFQAADVKGTFFVLGYVAEQFPDLIREIAHQGHEIGLHGYFHLRATQLTPQQFQEDLLRGKVAVQKACGVTPRGFRAPMFSISDRNLWALDILAKSGFLYDSSVYPIRNSWYGYPSAPRHPYKPLPESDFIEIPLSTVVWMGLKLPVAGGFYLRVMPYGLFKQALQRINQEGLAANIYLHPWDIDPDQPVPNPTLRERFTHYVNLRTTEKKILQMFKDFSFKPLMDLLNKPGFVKEGGGNGRV